MRAIVFAILLGIAGGAHSESLSPTGSDAGVGPTVAGIDRSFRVLGTDVDGSGVLAGVHGYIQRGAGFRAEARLLTGTIEYEAGGSSSHETATRLGARSSWGYSPNGDDRLYIGGGFEWLGADSGDTTGDKASWSLYAPIGYARSSRFTPGWQARVAVEGQLVLVGRDSIEDAPGVGDADFERAGGGALLVSVQMAPLDARLSVTPYLRLQRVADTETERINGTDVELENGSTDELGLRIHWIF